MTQTDSQMNQSARAETRPGLAARAGGWSARHRKEAIFGWLGFVIVALVLGSAIGTKHMADADGSSGETHRAEQMIDRNFPPIAGESVLIQSSTHKPGSSQFQAAVKDVGRRLDAIPDVKRLKLPTRANGGYSKDGRSAIVTFDVPDPASKEAKKRVDPMLNAVAAAEKSHPGFRIDEFGDASANKALDDTLGKDFERAEKLSIPMTLVILIFAFGALVAAGLPVLLAISAVAATMGLVAIPSQVFPVDSGIASVILLIGMAVGVDYSLFYLRREREERARGRDPRSALAAAAATSGRAVLVSGLTVMVAMAGMFITGSKTFSSFGVGTILVVFVSMIGSLTVLPAMLSWLGDRVDKGRIPFVRRLRRADGEPRVWGRVVDGVLRRPVVSVLLSGAALVAIALPALGMNTKLTGFEDLPKKLAIVQTYDRLNQAFPGGQVPANVVVEAKDGVRQPQVQAAVAQLEQKALASGEMFGPIDTNVSPNGKAEKIYIPLAGAGTDAKSNHALATLRNDLIPRTVGSVPGVNAATTGETAGTKDFNDLMAARTPLVFAFVLGLAFVLMLVTFRSIVIPLKAIALNMLSVGAAYGLLVWVFQDGHGEKLLGFHSNGAITAWLPIFLFVVLFGLSMDYHVFIISRIKEAVDRGMKTEDAVAHGIKATAGTVTSAAFVMVAVFAIFATLTTIEMKELGVGLAAAILIDATIVRAVLLPATMKLLGKWNWYLPKPLRWLPRTNHAPVLPDRRPEPAKA
ncbi:MAG TPA: MMPL family transporter [Thermoleophilaceae bacterium]